MEPGIREFLKRILNAMSTALLWMIINATAGIKFGYAFPAGPIKMGNIIFYFWFVASLALLVFYIIRLWNKPVEIDE